jgi:hypothetical protein
MAVAEPIHLITGWEPEVPVGDTVLRQFVNAWAESLAGPVAAMGGRVERRAGLVAGDLARPAAYYNGVTLLRPPAPDAWGLLVDEVEQVLLAGPGSGDVFLWSAWPTPDLRRRGWELEGHPPLLLRPASGPLPPAGELEVRRVTDAAALATWERVAVEGYPLEDLAPWRPGVLFDQRVLATPLRLWVGAGRGACRGAPPRLLAGAAARAPGRPGRAAIGGPVQRHEPPRGRTQRLPPGHPLHAVATSPAVTAGGAGGHGGAM